MLGVVLAVAIILIVLIALAVRPGLPERVNESLDTARDTLTGLALVFVGGIKSYWSLEDREKRETRWLKERVRKEVKRRSKKAGVSDDRTIELALDLPMANTSGGTNPVSFAGAQTPMPVYAPTTGEMPAYSSSTGGPISQSNNPMTAQTQPPSDDLRTVMAIRRQVQEEYGMTPDGQAEPPSNQDIVTAWSIRFVYIVLVLVCVAADYVFTSSRAPTVIGGGSFTPPPFLSGLFQYLPVITGVLFVAVAALSGMLIDEFVVSHSNYVKIWPFIAAPMRIIGLILAILMFVIDVIAVIFLVIVGFAFQESLALPFITVLTVLVSIAIVIALGVLLAFPGLWQGLSALGLLIFGGAAALIAYALALVFVILSAIVALMGELNRAIWGRGNDPVPTAVNADTRNLAIVGYGSASNWAVELCRQFAALYGAHVWLAGTTATGRDQVREQKIAFAQVRAHDITPRDSATANSKGLVQNLTNNYSGRRAEEIKPLLWVVRDEELDRCLDDLQDLGSSVTHSSIKNVHLAILWIVSPGARDRQKIQDLAADLQEWTNREGSILTTTIVYETETDTPASRWGSARDPLFMRGLASLLGAGVRAPENSFANALTELQKSKYTFSYLAAGSIGIDSSHQNFQTGFVSGRAGEINPLGASDRVKYLAGEVLKDQTCSTVPDKAMEKPTDRPKPPVTNDEAAQRDFQASLKAWQAVQSRWLQQQGKVFVNIVVPTARKALKQRKRFQDEVSEWMRNDYGIFEQHIAVVPALADRDHGIDIRAQWPHGTGEYYFSLTALRGVSDAQQGLPAIPQDFQNGIASPERSNMLDRLYGPVKPATVATAASPVTGAIAGSGTPTTNGNSGNGSAGGAGGYAPYPTTGGAPAGTPYPATGSSAGAAGGAYAPPPMTPYPDTSAGIAAAAGGANSTVNLYPTPSATPSANTGSVGGGYTGGYQGPNAYGTQNPTPNAYPDLNAGRGFGVDPWNPRNPNPDQQNGSEKGS